MPMNSLQRCYSPWELWKKLCSLYKRSIEGFFAVLGDLVANHPLIVIFLSLFIMGALASGFVFMKSENRTEKLYIPQDSESIKNLKKAKSYGFYRPNRQTEVILLSNAGNVLTKECFQAALFLHEQITNITGYKELCLTVDGGSTASSARCLTKEPLQMFNYNSSNFENLLAKLNDPKSSNNLHFGGIFGKISRNISGQIISAQALRLVYYLQGTDFEEKVSKETLSWEKEFLSRMKSAAAVKCGRVFYTTGRSMDDSIRESTGADIKLFSITFTVMISFACFMLGKYRNPLTGHGLLAMGGVLSVGFGIMASFGLSMLCGIPFISIVGILPFLIVGVGIDDMFIIVDELDRTQPDLPIPKRLSMVMRHVGPAITMTTMTDLLAFAIGTTSKFPSVVYFCTYAALAIMFAFFFLVTIFVAFMAYDCRRMKAGRRDMVPCLIAPAPRDGQPRWDEPLPQTSNKVMESWGKILMKPGTKVVVVIVSVALLGLGVYSTTFINEEFNRQDLAKDDSPFVEFLDTFETYFTELDIQVDLILESGMNYSDPSTQDQIGKLSDIVEENRYYSSNLISWFDEYRKWKNNSVHSPNFMISLKRFLDAQPRFRSDIFFSVDNSSIEASRIRCFMKQTISSVTLRDAMTTLRTDLSVKSNLPVFASAYQFIFMEQFVLIVPETIRNLSLAAAAILIVTTLFLVNPLVVFMVLLGFVSLIFELLGLMNIWGVSLNSISMINLVMAIGFAVDYSAHIAHAFVFSSGTNAEERVVDALKTLGASVFMGGFSTFLGMVITAFGSSEIFRIFFKMFFGIVVLGLLHGLCFLPVWLSIVCRHQIDVDFLKGGSDGDEENASATHNPTSSAGNISQEMSKTNQVVDLKEMDAGPSNSDKKVASSSSRVSPTEKMHAVEESGRNSNAGFASDDNVGEGKRETKL